MMSCVIPCQKTKMVIPSTNFADKNVRRGVIDVVAALIAHVQERGRYLVTLRAPGQTRENQWEFPGGKIEANEQWPEALARELREELNVTARIGPLFLVTAHRYQDVSIRLWTYRVEIAGIPEPGPSHSRVAWMLAAEMLSADFSAADLPVIRALEAGIGRD